MTRSPTGRKVFVTNLGYHDFSKALRYGDVIGVTIGTLNLTDIEALTATISEKLKGMTHEDYLLITGNPVVVHLCTDYLLRIRGFPLIRILYYSAVWNEYVELGKEDLIAQEAQIEVEESEYRSEWDEDPRPGDST